MVPQKRASIPPKRTVCILCMYVVSFVNGTSTEPVTYCSGHVLAVIDINLTHLTQPLRQQLLLLGSCWWLQRSIVDTVTIFHGELNRGNYSPSRAAETSRSRRDSGIRVSGMQFSWLHSESESACLYTRPSPKKLPRAQCAICSTLYIQVYGSVEGAQGVKLRVDASFQVICLAIFVGDTARGILFPTLYGRVVEVRFFFPCPRIPNVCSRF